MPNKSPMNFCGIPLLRTRVLCGITQCAPSVARDIASSFPNGETTPGLADDKD
ncbi:hypothetical protein N9030_00430 [bacterium]|nr:hypothetical protein [bacterium]